MNHRPHYPPSAHATEQQNNDDFSIYTGAEVSVFLIMATTVALVTGSLPICTIELHINRLR